MITAREDTSTFAALVDERARILDYMARHLQETVGETPGFLAKTSDYVLSTPGKLLRPLLLLDACRAAGGDPERVIPAAAGTEFGHIVADGPPEAVVTAEAVHDVFGTAVAIYRHPTAGVPQMTLLPSSPPSV